MAIFTKNNSDNSSSKSEILLYNLIFPLWVFPFIPTLIPRAFAVKFAIDAIIVWIYLKKHKKFNNLKIYCFRAPGSERTNLPQIDSRAVFRYSFKAAIFGYFADFLGGVAMIGLLETTPFDQYIDTYYVWSNFISGLLHVLVILPVGILIYLYHRSMGKRLNLNTAEAHGLGLIMGILTAPWFFLIPTTLRGQA